MPLHDPLDDDQAEAGAARVRARAVAAPEELREELALFLRGHADARVVHHHLDRAVGRLGAHPHLAGPRVLDRVRDQVPEHLDEAIPVAHDRRQLGEILPEAEPVPCGLDPKGRRDVAQDPAEVDQLLAQLDASGLDLGDVEEVVDQGAQPVRALGGHLEKALLELRDRPAIAVEHQLDVAAQRRQRRAQLVRDRGHELVLHPVDRPPLRHVARDDDERAAGVGRHRAHGQLDGEAGAVLAHALDLRADRAPRPVDGAPELQAGQARRRRAVRRARWPADRTAPPPRDSRR